MKNLFLLSLFSSLLFADVVYKSTDYIFIDNVMYERTTYITKNDNQEIVNIEKKLIEVSKENKYY